MVFVKGQKQDWPRGRKGRGEAYLWLEANVGFQGPQCLRWPFAYDLGVGRGRLGWNGKNYWAHRLMCEMARGPAPEARRRWPDGAATLLP